MNQNVTDDQSHTVDLPELAVSLLERARSARAGRAATTVYGGRDRTLRQTVLALLADNELAEHDSPGDATVQVLQGHVQMTAGNDTWEAKTGELMTIPRRRHNLLALQDSVVILTVAAGS